MPNSEVARQVGMAPSGVLERVRKLEKQGIIDGYEVRLNPERFGRSLVGFVFVTTAPGADEAAVGKALAKIRDVQEVHYVAGEDGFMVKLRASDTAMPTASGARKSPACRRSDSTRTLIALATFKETARIPLTMPPFRI